MITRRNTLALMRSTLAFGAIGTAAALTQCQPTEAPAAEADPILDLIAEYRRQMRVYNASDDLSDDDDDALAHATYGPSWDRLRSDPPPIRTYAGAVAALTLVAEEMESCTGSFELPVIRAVVAYFDRRA